MLPKTRKNCEREMKHTWNSFCWLYKEKLQELDHMTRRMLAEMSALQIPHEMAREYLEQEFARLWNEVAEEEDKRYGKNGKRKRGG
ncbi:MULTISPECIES: hypothetical protein [unclassified Paenibacillus]|uniref:hypothetical protein n=1 Tax=unclassified Paenibacillus TaxID=185978 RepID=UPI003F8031AB